MYHKATLLSKAYYDTLEEMPLMAKVYYPDSKEPVEMSPEDICKLDTKDWYTVMHSVNWGSCDHWTSEKPSKWVKERFNNIIHYTSNGKADGKHIGYNRQEWSITLTKDSHYWKSEVWNS